MTTVLIFFLVLILLVMVHEAGHFFAAKICKMRVEEFAFGFPPRLYSKKSGETEYSFNALPIGGYVKITGESLDEAEREKLKSDKKAFQNRPKLQQLFVLSAGVIMNLVLAVVLFSFAYSGTSYMAVSNTEYGDKTYDRNILAVGVMPGSPSEKAGIVPGDYVLSMTSRGDSADLISAENVVDFVKEHNEHPITIVYKRPSTGAISTTTVAAVYGLIEDRKTIGLSVDYAGKINLNFKEAVVRAVSDTYTYTKLTIVGLGDILAKLWNGESVMNALAGPVGIAKMVGGASEAGLSALLIFTAILSINLAVFNALPIPALDGGRIVFVLIEAVTRRPLNLKFQYWANSVSFLFLLSLIAFVTIFDILR